MSIEKCFIKMVFGFASQITKFYLIILLHPPSAFDTPNRIITEFKVFDGLLRQRLSTGSSNR